MSFDSAALGPRVVRLRAGKAMLFTGCALRCGLTLFTPSRLR
jgi:hypothetical protein